MEVKKQILKILSKQKRMRSSDVAKALSRKVSRQYINTVIRDLIKEGRLVKIGSTRSAFYVFPEEIKKISGYIKKRLRNKSLEEHEVFEQIEKQLPGLSQLKKSVGNVYDIFVYAFSEMLNNAIEHSKSKFIEVEVIVNKKKISFTVNDFGIGVFKNIMQKRNLKSQLEAIQDLLKGKTTTQPQAHSGEGIFFTSKSGDLFVLDSFEYSLRVDNTIKDVFIETLKPNKKGTKVFFEIPIDSSRRLNNVFRKYQTDPEGYAFDKTEVRVKLYTLGTIYISRSQARRILAGLEKFKSIILDFDKVSSMGQAFADEVFRVFQVRHPDIKIIPINANKAVQFMIDRVEKD